MRYLFVGIDFGALLACRSAFFIGKGGEYKINGNTEKNRCSRTDRG